LLELKRALFNIKNDEARLNEALSEKSRLINNLANKIELQNNQFKSFKVTVNDQLSKLREENCQLA
jgi:hypothetical protein